MSHFLSYDPDKPGHVELQRFNTGKNPKPGRPRVAVSHSCFRDTPPRTRVHHELQPLSHFRVLRELPYVYRLP